MSPDAHRMHMPASTWPCNSPQLLCGSRGCVRAIGTVPPVLPIRSHARLCSAAGEACFRHRHQRIGRGAMTWRSISRATPRMLTCGPPTAKSRSVCTQTAADMAKIRSA